MQDQELIKIAQQCGAILEDGEIHFTISDLDRFKFSVISEYADTLSLTVKAIPVPNLSASKDNEVLQGIYSAYQDGFSDALNAIFLMIRES